jgi:hypothetical protein
MTNPGAAFQAYWLGRIRLQHALQVRFEGPVYLARQDPYKLARAIMGMGREVLLRHGVQPTHVVVDLPCSLFMLDNRDVAVVEDVARLLEFSPTVTVRTLIPLHDRQDETWLLFKMRLLELSRRAAVRTSLELLRKRPCLDCAFINFKRQR